jgi:hypothetical protein
LGDIPVKRIFIIVAVVMSLYAVKGFSQEAAPLVFDLAKMEQILKEAGDLQSDQPQVVAEKLNPLFAELRQMRLKGALKKETSKVYQDALLLLMRTQAILFAPENEMNSSLRELLMLNPKIDDSIFNPREKQLLEKVRSAETGTLSLQTNPPGCTVSYQGVDWGITPLDISLVAGSYPLALRRPGYFDQNFEAVIRSSETLKIERSVRRRAVDLPLSVNVLGASIFVNGQQAGISQPYNNWLAAVPPERQQDFSALVAQWKVDLAVAHFFKISEAPIGEAIKIELRAPCYETLVLNVSVKEQDVLDWNRPIVALPELRLIELKKDIGFVEISSTPAGGEVWIDGAIQGKSPISKDLCSGTHRVQIFHRSGQLVQEVSVRRGQAFKVQGELKPALAFLGIYGRNSESAPAAPIATDSETVSRRLYLRVTAFSDPRISAEEIEGLNKKGTLSIEKMLDPKISPSDLDLIVKKTAAEAGHADMILVGQKTADKYQFRLFSTIHPIPDLFDIPNLDEGSLDFIISQLNRTEKAGTRLQTPVLGLDLLESPKGLVVFKAPASANQALARGAIIRSVDQKPMNFKELHDYLRTRNPGQKISFEVASGKDAATAVPVEVQFAGAEYPWSMPDGFSNAVLVMLNHLIERDPRSDQSKFAGISLARGLMLYGEWKLALEALGKTNLEPYKSGICPGTVLYMQARAYEELGDRTNAESYYARTKDYPEATVGMSDGLLVHVLVEQRTQLQKKAAPQ